MLADEANMQKQKKREEQLRKWREREMDSTSSTTSTIESFDKRSMSMPKKETRVKFPKGTLFHLYNLAVIKMILIAAFVLRIYFEKSFELNKILN